MLDNIGETIKYLRTRNSLTQSQLGEKVKYSREQIARIESGHSKPSPNLLLELSKIFNFNLVSLLQIYNDFTSIEAYEGYRHLRIAIDNKDLKKIEYFSKELCTLEDFSKGEPLQLIMYCNALILAYSKHDYEGSINACLTALEVIYKENYSDLLISEHLTDTSYSILFLLCNNYHAIGSIDFYKELAEAILFNFQNIIFTEKLSIYDHSYNTQRRYLIAINNMAQVFFELSDYQESLTLIDKGIELSNEFDILTQLPYFVFLKVECMYKLEKISNAQEQYIIFKSLCVITKNSRYIKEYAENMIKDNYPLLM